ncbi:hypothetical protein [Streptomyces sp. SID13031]|uniref:hypothetical protein n=1 Tax=Streptomyces sp. SID13031 TaxID=2706046 RepID=UPI0013C94151|nr:hypothetical protein [Streptomyces sp. SID13031]NEA31899.1 hypothetical protein [Streptomyces sp. SID13031]
MRRVVAIGAVAGIVGVCVQVPAWAAAPIAPSEVQVSWSDSTASLVKTTWTDGGESNKLRIEYKDGTTADWATRKASLPNEVIGGRATADKVARISVVSVDAAGVESAAAVSPWFDTNLLGRPTVTAATPLADGSLRLAWKRTAVADTTPNDPLDLAGSPEKKVSLKVGVPWYEAPEELFPLPAGATTGVVPPRPHPYPAFVYLQNEWGTMASQQITAAAMKVILRKVPAFTQYGRPLVIVGQAGSDSCLSGEYCRLWQGNGVLVTMQTRAGKTKPWQYAGRFTAYADTENDDFGFEATGAAVGGREYRFYVPAWSYRFNDDWEVTGQMSTSPRYIPTQAYYRVAGFNTLTARVGQLVKTTVDVQPAGTVKADLQWYDGKAWHHGAYVPLTKGKGAFSFKASGRGTTRYWRVVVPKMTMNGLPIVATPSKAFKLTVR